MQQTDVALFVPGRWNRPGGRFQVLLVRLGAVDLQRLDGLLKCSIPVGPMSGASTASRMVGTRSW
jgi:hypothetical protein